MAKRVSRDPVAEGAELGRSGLSLIQDAGGSTPKAFAVTARGYKSAYWTRYSLLPLCLAQLSLGRFHVARRLPAKQNRTEFVSLVVTRDKFFLCVRALNIDPCRQHAEISYEIQRPTGNRLPLFVWIFRRTVLPSKPLRLSPIDKVTPCFAKYSVSQVPVSGSIYRSNK